MGRDMNKMNKVKYYAMVSAGSLVVLFYWWTTITDYQLGEPIQPLMLFWGIVFVFGVVGGPVCGLLVWPIIANLVFKKLKHKVISRRSKRLVVNNTHNKTKEVIR